MTSKKRFRNKYRLQLREKDHEPMHVHLVGGDVDVRIDLASLRIVAGRMPMDLKREVMAWLRAHQAELIEEWKKWHP
mgnify:CR=1 FL=1